MHNRGGGPTKIDIFYTLVILTVMMVRVTTVRSNTEEDRKKTIQNLQSLTCDFKSWVFYVGEDDQLNVNLIDKKPVYLYSSELMTVNILLSCLFIIFFFSYLTLIGLVAMSMRKKIGFKERRAFIFIFAHSSKSRFTDTIERIE